LAFVEHRRCLLLAEFAGRRATQPRPGRVLRRLTLACVLGAGMPAWGQPIQPLPAQPVPILPEAMAWFSPPPIPGLKAAWVVGRESGPAPYLLRVMLAKGARIPVHTHPDDRSSTVLQGTLFVGFGAVADDTRLVAIPPGGVYVAPANVPHFLWARDGEVVYQEAGAGPSATRFLGP